MKIVIFQGNYPSKYNGTRHNIGFEFADFLSKKNKLSWQEKPKFKAQIAEFQKNGEKILLVKPLTFYNETGISARALCNFYKIDWRKDLLVVHDDLDLNFGVIRVRNKGSAAGNNGLKSLIANLSEEFPRIKIGIKNDSLPRIGAMDFVLAKFSEEENRQILNIFEICEDFFEIFCEEKLQNEKKTI